MVKKNSRLHLHMPYVLRKSGSLPHCIPFCLIILIRENNAHCLVAHLLCPKMIRNIPQAVWFSAHCLITLLLCLKAVCYKFQAYGSMYTTLLHICTPPCYTSLVSLNGWAKKTCIACDFLFHPTFLCLVS